MQFEDREVEEALIGGMLPELGESAHAQLMERWVHPLGGDSPAVASMEEWLQTEEEALIEELRPMIHTAMDTHGMDWVAAFSTQGGSAWTPLVHRIQARMLTAWLTDYRPDMVRLAAEVTLGLNVGWPELHLALEIAEEIAPEDAEWASARDALSRAREGQPEVATWPELGPPLSAPGHSPGVEYSPPETQPQSATLRPGPRSPLRQHLLLIVSGPAFCLLILWFGIRCQSRWTRRLAALGLGLAILLSLEGLLRLLSLEPAPSPLFRFNGFDAAPLSSRDRSGETWLETPGGSMRHQVFSQDFDGDRVVVLGASSVHGSHYLAEEAFAAQLEQRLQVDAARPVEVLNMGIGGTLSDGIRATGLQALDNQADLLIIYYGHNEVGQFVQLERFAQVDPDALSTRIALSGTALGRLLQDLLHRPADGSLSGAGEAVFSGQPPSREEVDRLKALAVHNFRWNLSLLLDAAGRKGVPVILCQVATNYRFSHLNPLSEAGPGDQLDLDRLVQQAEAHAQAGRPVEARDTWQTAIDRSASPREVSSSIRQATEELAEAHAVTLVDIQEHFYQGSPDGLGVSGLFWDDLHPTVEGHALISEALLGPAQTLLNRY
jgi:lysophospholipase L1-like esterase